jgi:hypothetical protein
VSRSGEIATTWAFDFLARRLGPSWPRRQFEKDGRIPGELLLFGTHRAALPLFLAFATRLHAAIDEPSFAPVLTVLRRGVTTSDWRHILLQTEIARAARAAGIPVSFEPRIPGSPRKADVLLNSGESDGTLVEATTLLRSDADKDWQQYEDRLSHTLFAIESAHDVHTATTLTSHPELDTVERWLAEIADTAAQVRRTGIARTVSIEGASTFVYSGTLIEGAARFTGAPMSGDGWRRLGRALREKARQSAGPLPAWLRIDAADGFSQFTEWTHLPWPDRVAQLRAALNATLTGVPHLHGVVISSGPAVCLGATDPLQHDADAEVEGSIGLRRLLAPHLVRESLIVPLRDEGAELASAWAKAYSSEPAWLDQDLASLGLPALADCWDA